MIDQSYSLILPEDQPPRRVGAIKTALCVSEERTARALAGMMKYGQFFSAYELEKFVRHARRRSCIAIDRALTLAEHGWAASPSHISTFARKPHAPIHFSRLV